MKHYFFILLIISFYSCTNYKKETKSKNTIVNTSIFNELINLSDYNINPSKYVIKDSVLIVTEHTEKTLHFINLNSKTIKWTVNVKNWCTTPPVIINDAIYHVTYTGFISKFDFDGNLLWSKRSKRSYKGHIVNKKTNNLIIIGVISGVYEIDKNGDEIWEITPNKVASISEPIFTNNGMVLSGFLNENYDSLYIRHYDTSISKIIWETGMPYNRLDYSDPIISSNKIIINSPFPKRKGGFTFLDLNTGEITNKLKYQYNNSSSELDEVVVIDSVLFFSEQDSILTLFNINTMNKIKGVKIPFKLKYYSITKTNKNWFLLTPQSILILGKDFNVIQEMKNIMENNFKRDKIDFLTKEKKIYQLK